MIKAIIFDMGGVILRTVDPGKREQMAARLGTNRKDLEEMIFQGPSSIQSELGKISDEEHWKAVLAHYGIPTDEYKEISIEFSSGDAVDKEMITFIQSLKGDYKLGLLSNAWVNARKNIIPMQDYFDLFDVSIFSAEVGMRKPDERIYRLMLERLDVNPRESIFVDDFPANIEGASAIGMQAVLYRDLEQTIRDVNQILKQQNA